MKVCNVCREDKAPSEFHRRKASADGLCYTCKACANARAWLQYAADPDGANTRRRGAYAAHHARERAIRKAWAERNKSAVRAYFNAYRQWRNQRTPPWADLLLIRAVYTEAARRRAAGENVHVDHIIPMRGRRVSGLHVANNLRVVEAKENLAKSNTLIEELV